MIPILYAANETTFTHNGIGRLVNCTECIVTEERNGIYECEFGYPITGAFYNEISLDRLVKVKPNEMSDDQLFRIYRINKPIKGIVKVYCQHISYDLITNIVKPFTVSSATALEALQAILSNCYHNHSFTCASTASGTHNFEIKVPTAARQCLGGMEGSLLDTYGGEFEFDNYLIKLHGHRGQDTGVTILYGKNLTSVKADSNLSGTYNAIFPYAVDEEDDTPVHTLDGNTKVIPISGATTYGEPRTLAVDLTDKFDLEEEDITSAKLRQYAEEYLSESDLDSVYQNIEVSFVQLWQTEEYKNVALLERVSLCDTVTVRYEKLGVDATAKVVKTVYNVLTEKYDKIELGNVKSNFVDEIRRETKQQIQKSEEDNRSALQRAIDNATALITGQEGGHVVINQDSSGKPKEILIMNTDNIQTATKVWRWNLGGLGYSSTGYSGSYGVAMTMDGSIVANYITSGTMSGERIKAGTLSATKITTGRLMDASQTNYWNLENGNFRLSDGTSTAILLNNGTLTMNASFITTGTLNAARVKTGILEDTQGTNYWNLDTGEFRLSANTKVGSSASSPTLSNYVATTADASVLTQQKVFNALTNNGQTMGIFLNSTDNKLYINASYISTGYISANIINSGTMSADRIKTGKITSEDGYATFDLDNGRIALSQRQSSATTGSIRLSTGGITLLDPSNTYLGSWQVGTETSGGSVSYKSSMVTNWLTVDTLTVNDKINSFSTPVLTATTRVESPVIQANTSLYAQEISSPRAILSSLYVQGASPKLYFDGKQLSYVQTTVNGKQWLLVGYPVSGYTPSVTTDINLANTYYDTDHSGAAKKAFTELFIASTDGKTYNVAAYNLNSSSSASTHIEDVSLNSHALGISDTVTYGGTSYKLLTYDNNRYQSLNPNATSLYYNGHTFSPVAVKIGPITFTLLGYEVT